MNCPYCHAEMKNGKLITAGNCLPYWLEDGKKRTLSDAFDGKGSIPVHSGFAHHSIESAYCPACRKIIIDVSLTL